PPPFVLQGSVREGRMIFGAVVSCAVGWQPQQRLMAGQFRVKAMEKCSVYIDSEQEAACYKWIESEKAGRDLGAAAIRRWVKDLWTGYLRARWGEHLQGRRFWVDLDRGDFGLLQRRFHDNTLLPDRILDRLKTGRENLDVILWAQDWNLPITAVLEILE